MSGPAHGPDGSPRRPWSRSERPVPRLLVRPVEQFMRQEAAGGIVLAAATVAALLWANLDAASYAALWDTAVRFEVGAWTVEEDLLHVVNDGLMALFFLVIGLEVKRELTVGELRDPKAASLPFFAAIGGMVAPALVFFALPAGTAGGSRSPPTSPSLWRRWPPSAAACRRRWWPSCSGSR